MSDSTPVENNSSSADSLANDPIINDIWAEDGQLKGHEQDLDVNSWLKEIADDPTSSESKASPKSKAEPLKESKDALPEQLPVADVNKNKVDLEDVEFGEVDELGEEAETYDEHGDGSELNPEIKTISFKNGEQEFQVPEEAVIEIMVDGELTEVSLSEIKNGISGQKAISRRFSELDVERKALQAQQAEITDTMALVNEYVQQGRGLEAAGVMFEKAGLSTEHVFIQMFEQLAPHLEQYVHLTPQQQQLYQEKLQAQADKIRAQKLEQEANYLRTEKTTRLEMENFRLQSNLQPAQVVELYDNLKAEMASGSLKKQPITPELLKNYHGLVQKETKAKEALRKVDPQAAENMYRITEVVAEANKIIRNRGLDINRVDFDRIVAKIYSHPNSSVASVQTAPKVNQPAQNRGPVSTGKPNPNARRGQQIGKMLQDIANADDSTIDQLVKKHSQQQQGKPRHY